MSRSPETLQDYAAQLMAITTSSDTPRQEPKVSVQGNVLALESQPSGHWAHIALLLIWILPPLLLVIEESSLATYVISLAWMLVFGRSFYSIFKSDLRIKIDTALKMIVIENINPVLCWMRNILPWRFHWEQRCDWSQIKHLTIRHRIHTKLLSGHQIEAVTIGKNKIPLCEYSKEKYAWQAMNTLSQIMKLPHYSE